MYNNFICHNMFICRNQLMKLLVISKINKLNEECMLLSLHYSLTTVIVTFCRTSGAFTQQVLASPSPSAEADSQSLTTSKPS